MAFCARDGESKAGKEREYEREREREKERGREGERGEEGSGREKTESIFSLNLSRLNLKASSFEESASSGMADSLVIDLDVGKERERVCACVCICACARESERERKRERGREQCYVGRLEYST